MKAININTGCCHARLQQGNLPFFVNWEFNNKTFYYFSNQSMAIDMVENGLKRDPKLYSDYYGNKEN